MVRFWCAKTLSVLSLGDDLRFRSAIRLGSESVRSDLFMGKLGWHVCRTKFARDIFFRATQFLMKNAPNLCPKCLSLYFCGSEKIPQNCRQISHKISLPKIKKIHRRASASGQGEGNWLRFSFCSNSTLASAMPFATKNGQMWFSAQKFACDSKTCW